MTSDLVYTIGAFIFAGMFLAIYAADKDMPGGNPLREKYPRALGLIGILSILAMVAYAIAERITDVLTLLILLYIASFFVHFLRKLHAELKEGRNLPA
jgi:hypothetical protein